MQSTPKKLLSPAKARLIVGTIGIIEGWRKISGLGGSTDTAEFYEGGNPNPIGIIPTTNKWDDIKIERARTTSHAIRDWVDRCMSGRFRAEDLEQECTLQHLDLNNQVLFADTYHRGIGTGYTESDKESKPGDVVIETVTIKHMGRDLTQR